MGYLQSEKSIYDDIEGLRLFGLDIIMEKRGGTNYYYIGSRRFELAELKLLVDSVQSSKFITAKKSGSLIKKIEELASRHEAKKLHRQVYVADRIKTMNESIYYNVDKIHTAIGANVKITFQYFQWNVRKEMELRHDGELYEVSPWALSWDAENYYLIAFDEKADKIKHFRVDKMLGINLTRERRKGDKSFEKFDISHYTNKMFGMFGGEESVIHIECDNRLANVIIDRFGKDVHMQITDEEHFVAKVKVAVSPQFISWIAALGEGAKIIAPDEVVQQVKAEIERMVRQYGV